MVKKKEGRMMKKIANYFAGVRKEIGRVRWTNKKDLTKYSIATFVFMVFFGVFFYLIDLGMAFIRTLG